MRLEANAPRTEDSSLSAEQREKLQEVAQQFEAVFINQMVGAMRKSVQNGGLIPESQGEKVYKSMLDNEYAAKMAESRQFGLSDLIYEHLLRSSGAR